MVESFTGHYLSCGKDSKRAAVELAPDRNANPLFTVETRLVSD